MGGCQFFVGNGDVVVGYARIGLQSIVECYRLTTVLVRGLQVVFVGSHGFEYQPEVFLRETLFLHVLFEIDPLGAGVHDLLHCVVGILRKVIAENDSQKVEQFGFVGEHLLYLGSDVVALQHIGQLFFRYGDAYLGSSIADDHFAYNLVEDLFVDACRITFGQRHSILLTEHGLHLFGATVYQFRKFLCCYLLAVYHYDILKKACPELRKSPMINASRAIPITMTRSPALFLIFCKVAIYVCCF